MKDINTTELQERIENSTISATPKQVAVFLDYIDEIKSGNPDSFRKIMRRNGYSDETSKKPKAALLSSEGWKQLMSLIPEMEILANMCRIAMGEKGKSNKKPADGNQIKAAKLVFKLNNRFPDKNKTVTLQQKRQKILNITDNED
ncbi:MAG: hypothetical protein ACOCTT_02585 [archaeon]